MKGTLRFATRPLRYAEPGADRDAHRDPDDVPAAVRSESSHVRRIPVSVARHDADLQEAGNLVNILKVLGARVRAPTQHDIVLRCVVGRYASPLFDELKQDIHAFVKDVLDEMLVD